jgi:hypothetical protein
MIPEGVPTPVPISDADNSARVLPGPRLWCTTVCDDGLSYGASMPGPHCTGVQRCLDRGGCFWRSWHKLPPDMMRKKCDGGLDD